MRPRGLDPRFVCPARRCPVAPRLPEPSDSHHRDLCCRARFRYTHRWQVGDVLMWDHLGTWHNAVADYTADEPRLMKRCQVLADKVFDPAFTSGVLAAA